VLAARAAASLLSASRSLSALENLLVTSGIAGPSAALDREAVQALGLDEFGACRVSAGVGAQRVIQIALAGDHGFRESLQRIGRKLVSRAPHVFWLAAVVDSDGTHCALAGCHGARGQARLSVFGWEPDHVVDSDVETLCALAAVHRDDDVPRHARMLEVLGREAVTRRFYRALENEVDLLAREVPDASREDARSVALLYVSRLLFLCFLEAKGWLDGDRSFLSARYDECMRSGGQFHRRILLPLFFGTLNTPASRRAAAARAFGRVPFLNGGLFTRTVLERRLRAGRWRFSDERFGGALSDLFLRYRFVAREDTAAWSEASVDPEMLGRAFESLMASTDRKSGGVYYTPHDLVARVADEALRAAAAHSRADLRTFRVLDPACGSGAFLVHMLERVADLRLERGEHVPLADVRRDVLARSIFGVDLNPTAVWLCELRLWLAVVIESAESDPLRIAPLPNLDRNIRVGDSLSGTGFLPGEMPIVGSAALAQLRQRYIRATGARKQNAARALDRAERRRAIAQLDRRIDHLHFERGELLRAQRARDLFGERQPVTAEMRRETRHLRDVLRETRRERRRVLDGAALPFSFAAFFADAHSAGGFDVVVGNPPWVRLHRIPPVLRLRFRKEYEVFRNASWEAGARAANAAQGFASQVDLAALFVERAVTLTNTSGVVSLLLPVKLWRSLAGGGLRRYLLEHTRLVRLDDLSEARSGFDAAVYPSLLVVARDQTGERDMAVAVHDRSACREWRQPARAMCYDASPGAPWLTLPPEARRVFDRLRNAGPALAESSLGSPRLGVKSGCNAAFIVRVTDTEPDRARVIDANGEPGFVELEFLRPALRGENVAPWFRSSCEEWIVWTHDEHGPVPRLPHCTREWLGRHYGALTRRADASRARRWWTLFRTDAADAGTARVVWTDFGLRPRALVLPSGDPTVPLNTCYVLPCADECDAWAIAAILNSPIAAAWLNAIAEPARGHYRRYLGWTVSRLPLPKRWTRARKILSAARGFDDDALLTCVLDAYELNRLEVTALLEWQR